MSRAGPELLPPPQPYSFTRHTGLLEASAHPEGAVKKQRVLTGRSVRESLLGWEKHPTDCQGSHSAGMAFLSQLGLGTPPGPASTEVVGVGLWPVAGREATVPGAILVCLLRHRRSLCPRQSEAPSPSSAHLGLEMRSPLPRGGNSPDWEISS